jgi:hypothetical protein
MGKQVAWMAARPLGLTALLVGAAIVLAQDRPPPADSQGVRPGQQAQPGQAAEQPRVARLPAAGGQQAGRLPNPVMDTAQLMALFNKPLYDLLKEEMADLGQLDEKKRQTIEQRGLQAAEVANLIVLRPHARDPQSQARWHAMAAELQQAGLQLAEASEAGEGQAVHQAYTGLIQRCNACHQATAPDHAPKLEL